MNTISSLPMTTNELVAAMADFNEPTTKKVRVVLRKRQASVVKHQVAPAPDSGKVVMETSSVGQPKSLVDYKNRTIKSRRHVEQDSSKQRQRQRSTVNARPRATVASSKTHHPKKQTRFDTSNNTSHAATPDILSQDELDAAFYSADNIDCMIKYHYKLATRSQAASSKIRHHDDLRGLEDFMTANAMEAAQRRKQSYCQAVLNEQTRQRDNGDCTMPEEIRKQARIASKTSRTIALQRGQQDAQQVILLAAESAVDSVSSRPRLNHVGADRPLMPLSMRIRSKSTCGGGPSIKKSPLATAAVATTSFAAPTGSGGISKQQDRRSRRSASMRVSVRTATVVM